LIANGYNPITGQTMRLVANGLMALFQSEFSSEDTVKIAGSMVVTAPLFVFFLIFRKYIMRGVSRSGIKG
jgi:multiple sugar transport system permease protein